MMASGSMLHAGSRRGLLHLYRLSWAIVAAVHLPAVVATVGSASAQNSVDHPLAVQVGLHGGAGMVDPASSAGRSGQFLYVEVNAWRGVFGLAGRLDAVTVPQVCSVIIPVRCSHPGDLAIGSIVGLSVVSAWLRRVTARATAGGGAFRWSDGSIDPAFELDGGIEVMTSPPIGVRLGAMWRMVWADEAVSVLGVSIGVIGRLR